MKHTGIHILDFNDKIIDYISRDDGALLNAVMSYNAEEKSETFDFTMLNDRAEHLRERNRIIAQDNNGVYREFIISHVVDNFDGTTDVESNASYLEDIDKSRPIKPGKYSSYSTSQALNETLRNTGWEISDDTEHGGMRTTSWASYSTPYEVINMLCTTYGMVAEYYIELGSHTVEHRYVSLKKPTNLFKGKEITKGKDLTGMTRTVDMSEVRTALYAIGPENDTGQRLEKIVTDDDAQAQFGLPGRYLWSVYEPESDDSNMTDARLTTLAKTELNKRNKSAISYEITSTDIHKHYPEMVVSLHDTVRIKDRDFRPPLYIEAEVIGVDYNLLTDESDYKFGNVVEYEENNLRDIFNKKLANISKKLNDNVTNINTIVNDVVSGQLEYYERKIFKQDTPPDNPVNDMLWYDTRNPNVAVLRRYWNGEWLNETVDDVEKIGGITREKALLSELQNTFANLSIQHSKILNDTNKVLNSEYLVDTDLKNKLQTEINNIDEIYLSIQNNLNAMTPDTATIGALIDVQSRFSSYRQKLQDLYKAMRDAQVSADKRLKLLQSQYTDEKFNDALNKVAAKFGLTIDENNNMVGTPDVIEKAVQASREDTEEQLKSYVKSVDYQTDQNGIVQRLDSADSERLQLSNQISDRVTLKQYNDMKIGTRNLLLNSKEQSVSTSTSLTYAFMRYYLSKPLEIGKEYTLISEVYSTSEEQSGSISVRAYTPDNGLITVPIENNRIKVSFVAKVESTQLLLYKDVAGQSPHTLDTNFKNTMLVEGNKIGDYEQAPEETEQRLTTMQTSIEQNGTDINARATKEEFNASRKTLSKVVSDLTVNTTTGITLSYDENGAIQSSTVGPEGVKIRGDKVDIAVNKEFQVLAGNVDDKVGKGEIINRLNLSPEGLDINVNKIGIRGGDATNYINIKNDNILSYGKFERSWAGTKDTANLELGISNGRIMVRNQTTGYRLYLTERGLSTMMDGFSDDTSGTLEFHSKRFNDTSRGITMHSTYGAVAMLSEQSRAIIRSNLTANIESYAYGVYIRPYFNTRPGVNEFNFYVKDNDNAGDTDGALLFGEVSDSNGLAGSGLRFKKKGIRGETSGDYEPMVYATDNAGNIGSGSFYGNNFYGDWKSKGGYLYAMTPERTRFTDMKGYNNGNTSYTDIQCQHILANTIRTGVGKDFYIGVSSNELRVTNNLFWNGGDTGYKPIRASDYLPGSLERFKKDIIQWDGDALNEIVNNMTTYEYRLKDDEDDRKKRKGLVIGEDYKTPEDFIDGDGVSVYNMIAYSLRAIQQLNEKIEKLEEQINGK
ncbi:phage tail spike protein [Staphylococcus cohnii]|uniref:phage tail spike protein n=1 Tax=Staphylococcus cohnii TaxID=29382 RepID=UPI003CE9052A